MLKQTVEVVKDDLGENVGRKCNNGVYHKGHKNCGMFI